MVLDSPAIDPSIANVDIITASAETASSGGAYRDVAAATRVT